MSALLAVVSSVVASPSPLPSPVVVHDTILKTITVAAHSPQFMRGAQLALLFLVGLGGSWVHQFFQSMSKKPGGWSDGVNIALQFLFGIVVATVAAFVTGGLTLDWASAENFAASLLVVLGTSQGRFMFKKWTDSLGTDELAPSPLDPAAADPSVPQKASL